MKKRQLAIAAAMALIVGAAIFLAMPGSDARYPVAGIRPTAVPVVAAIPESAPHSTQAAPVPASPRTGSAAASSPLPRAPAPHAPDATVKTDPLQWKSWRDAPPIDRDHALNLLADMVAEEREGNADENALRIRRKFERNPVDSALSEQASEAVQTFLSGLDVDVQQHITLGAVECRGSACQVLVAANGFVGVIDGNVSTPQGPIDCVHMEQASMPGQPWWSESGYVVDSTSSQIGRGYAICEFTFVRQAK